jgi:uncharacterized membrane protein
MSGNISLSRELHFPKNMTTLSPNSIISTKHISDTVLQPAIMTLAYWLTWKNGQRFLGELANLIELF